MLVVLFAFAFCKEDFYHICIGKEIECIEYTRDLGTKEVFEIIDDSHLDFLKTKKPNGVIAIASRQKIMLTLDYSEYSSVNLYFFGISNNESQILLKLHENTIINCIRLYKVSLYLKNGHFSESQICNLSILSSKLDSSSSIIVQNMIYDSYSSLLTQEKPKITKKIKIDLNVDLDTFILSPEVDIEHSIIAHSMVKINSTSLNFYDKNEELIFCSEIEENMNYYGPLNIFDENIEFTVNIENPTIPIDQYRKIHFGPNTKIKFNGTYPGGLDVNVYIFYLSTLSTLIINSSYVPVCFPRDCNLVFNIKEYSLTKFQRIDPEILDFPTYFYSSENFQKERLTILIQVIPFL